MESKNKNICSVLIKKKHEKNPLIINYKECGKQAKYKVNYKEGMRGKLITEYLCGTHFKALQMNSNGAKIRLEYDCELKYEKI